MLTQDQVKQQIRALVQKWCAQYKTRHERAAALESIISGISLTAAFLSSNDGAITPETIGKAAEAVAAEYKMQKGKLR